MNTIRHAAIAIIAGLHFHAPAMAEEIGKREYMDNCATCHGESGMG